jgi:hypothetical protein
MRMSKAKIVFRLVITLLVSALGVAVAAPQSVSEGCDISGRVVDSSGAVLPGAGVFVLPDGVAATTTTA